MLDGRKISQYFPAVYYLFGDNMTVDDFATVTQRIIRGCIEPHEEKVFKVY